MSQQQKGGIGSTNIQAEAIYVSTGLSVADVKEIAKDLFRENFSVLNQTAKRISEERAQEIRDDLMEALAANGKKLDGFSQPEKQVALLDAQKAYALTGDKDLKSILINTVVKMSSEPERSLKSIVLHEALRILPTLTQQHLMTISVAFITLHVNFGKVKDIASLSAEYEKHIGRNWKSLSPTDGDFRHIEYSRCGAVSVLEGSFTSALRGTYPAVLSVGFDLSQAEEWFKESGIPRFGLMPCFNDANKFQVAATQEAVVDNNGAKFGWTSDQISILKKHFREHLMDDAAAKQLVSSCSGCIAHVMGQWDGTSLCRLTLTSVGIAVAHAYINSINKDFVDIDIWL